MADLRWHPQASSIVDDLTSPEARRVHQVSRLLLRFPHLGMPVQDPALPGLRRVLAGGWSVIYQYDGERDLVIILMLVPPGTAPAER